MNGQLSNDQIVTAQKSREWRSRLAIWTAVFLLFETVTGLSIWLLPFSIPNQVMVLAHTLLGVALLLPVTFYLIRHWRLYSRQMMTSVKLLGYLGGIAFAICVLSGVWLTFQAIFRSRISYSWDMVHILSTMAVIAFAAPHVLILLRRYGARVEGDVLSKAVRPYAWSTAVVTLLLFGGVALATFAYFPVELNNEFGPDYSFSYGEDRPFAPSLATTATGGAIDGRSLAGSQSCGTSLCHEQIVEEWSVSAHRYSAMDLAFQKIQLTMAEQNGPDSTRYCGGCHDPISLFSGTKNIFTDPEQLTSLHGYQEGVSCLVCHAVQETDLKGNAHYVITQPSRYMFELEYDEAPHPVTGLLRDFLIRAYPRQHVETLSKRLFKAPEYCAACHKQFIDEEINNVGWVQLQNQFDNWRMSRWNHPDDPERTIECRECHMPLVESNDPASGDEADYNRDADDGRHRSHRFIAANLMMPQLLDLPGWQQQAALTEQWLKGDFEIPEISEKWPSGPAVSLELILPEEVAAGESASFRTLITSNKVGHDFPTGPLDIIQSWVEIVVTDDSGAVVFGTGRVDEKGFIEPGSFILKAEPVDQYGNVIDRHNLWEMVGVRHRRALFPGFSDVAEFRFFCPDVFPSSAETPRQQVGDRSHEIQVASDLKGKLHVRAALKYRKVDQNLLNFVFGEESGLTAPVTELSVATGTIPVVDSTGD